MQSVSPASILLVILWLIFAHNIEMVYCVVSKVVCSSWCDPVQAVRFWMVEINSLSDCGQNISQSVEGEYTYLRINFFHPGATLGKADGNTYPNADLHFLKEMWVVGCQHQPHAHIHVCIHTCAHTHTHTLCLSCSSKKCELFDVNTPLPTHTLPQETVNLIRL